MTFAGIFHLIAKGMPEATSDAGLRAQPTEDDRHTSFHLVGRPKCENWDGEFFSVHDRL